MSLLNALGVYCGASVPRGGVNNGLPQVDSGGSNGGQDTDD